MEKSNQIQKIPKMSILAAVLLILIWIDQVIRKCFEDEDFCSFVVISGIFFVSTAILSLIGNPLILVRNKFKSSVSNQANLAVNQNGLNQCICKLYHFDIK